MLSHSGLRSQGSILQWLHRADLWVFGCFKSKGAQCFAPMKERRLLGLPSTVYHQITGATQIYQLNVMSLLKPLSTSILLKWWRLWHFCSPLCPPFRARKIPIIIRRYLPDGSYEDWGVDELIITDWSAFSHWFGSFLLQRCFYFCLYLCK